MRQSRFAVEEIIRIIAESELPTSSIAGTARKYGIKEATLYRWRAKYTRLRLPLALLEMARATFYRQGRGRPEEERLQERIQELAHAEASFGYRRITAVVPREGRGG